MRRRVWSPRLLGFLPDIALLLFLAAVAWLAAGNYVRSSLFIWGDHPGQYMRFWYPAAVSVPHYGRLVDWNPLWYAGYPELQFYPPGHAILGLVLSALTLGQLSLERVYNLIPAIALVLPAFSTSLFLRVALAPVGRGASRVAGLVAGLLALSFTPMWGGTNAVSIGLMGERLAFGVVPLALLAGWKLVEQPNGRRLAIAAALLATLVLLHPFHSPAVVLAVGGYAVARHLLLRTPHTPASARDKRRILLAGWLLLAGGLTAWWVLPLLVRQTPYAAALVRTNLSQTFDWLRPEPLVPNLLVAAAPALVLLAHRDWRVRAGVGVLVLLIPMLILIIVADYTILMERLHFTALDPIRFIAEYYMAFILLTGAAAGAVVSRFVWRLPPLAISLAVLMGVALGPTVPTAWNDVRDHAAVPVEHTKDGLLQHPAFDGLWETLRDDPATDGRVLFTSYYFQVAWPDGRTTPTAIKAMTPNLTGREIVGGTFSHWSPGARLLWVGDPWARLLPAQVELEDDQRLLGVPWDEMDDAALFVAMRALNVTTIVADADDVHARSMLDRASHFKRFWENGYFILYHVLDAGPAWVDADGAAVRLGERSARRWVVQVDQAAADAVLTAKMAFYPLWRADADGRPLVITPNEYGMQEIKLPAGGPYTVSLTYREGWPEWSGLMVTGGALGAMALLWLRRPQRKHDYTNRNN